MKNKEVEAEKDIRYTQPLPPRLCQKIDADAQLENRSRTQQVVWVLRNYYKNIDLENKEATFSEA